MGTCLFPDGPVDTGVLAHGVGYFLGNHFQGIVAHGLHGGIVGRQGIVKRRLLFAEAQFGMTLIQRLQGFRQFDEFLHDLDGIHRPVVVLAQGFIQLFRKRLTLNQVAFAFLAHLVLQQAAQHFQRQILFGHGLDLMDEFIGQQGYFAFGQSRHGIQVHHAFRGDGLVNQLADGVFLFFHQGFRIRALVQHAANTQEKDNFIAAAFHHVIAREGVVDLYAVAGLPKSEISLLSDEFIHQIEALPEKNLALEMLRRLLQDKVRKEGKGNLIQSKAFSEKLEEALRKYHNRSVDTVEVMQELIELAKALQALDQRHAALGLSKDEAAFYDALATNDSAVQAMGDEALKMIAKEVADTVRQNTRIDWSIREQARAHLRRMVKRVLKRHGYPPDMQEGAVNMVIEQAEGLVA